MPEDFMSRRQRQLAEEQQRTAEQKLDEGKRSHTDAKEKSPDQPTVVNLKPEKKLVPITREVREHLEIIKKGASALESSMTYQTNLARVSGWSDRQIIDYIGQTNWLQLKSKPALAIALYEVALKRELFEK